jgi:hypothetical protein
MLPFPKQRIFLALVAASCAMVPVTASAEDADALAERLFREAESLFKAGSTHEACDKFAQSQKAKPGIGTLMNLAICHEKEGKIASAWAEYADVAEKAAAAKQTAREASARARAQELAPQVSRVALAFADESSVGDVTLDGTSVPRAAWRTPVPVDPGRHTFAFSAPGRTTAFRTLDVSAPGQQALEVPALQPETTSPEAAAPAPREDKPVQASLRSAEEQPKNTQRTIGYVVGGVGVVGVGLGAYFGISAASQDANCPDRVCATPADKRAIDDAKSSATVANVAIGLGAVALGVGAVLVLTAPRASRVQVSAGLRGIQLGGRF